ncbi:hypothetical protein BJY52DRAFT_1189284 [Lactarius psammicola]|nr:hypothetical protein BJY52DRAFT_1189284 [Lactarius psammicola]
MPKQPKLPPRDAAGKFIKTTPSTSQPSSDPPLDPSICEPEPSFSSSTLSDPIESSETSSTPRSSLVFPKPIRHSIPGSFSPLADSPSETSVPFSTLVSRSSRQFISPSLISIPESRSPSPLSLPPTRTFPALSVIPSDSSSSSSSSSASSSPTVSFVPQVAPKVFPVNLQASQFLSSHPDPPSTQTQLDLAPSQGPSTSTPVAPSLSSSSALVPIVPAQTSSSSITTVPAPPSISLTSVPPLTTSSQPAPPPVVAPPPLPPVVAPPPLLPVVAPPAVVPPLAHMAANLPTGPAAMPPCSFAPSTLFLWTRWRPA